MHESTAYILIDTKLDLAAQRKCCMIGGLNHTTEVISNNSSIHAL